jgi:hypothetical protein
MSTWITVDVDVDIELEDVIDFIDSASEKELEQIARAVKEEMNEYSSTFSSIRDTQLYSDLMDAVEEAVTRHVDMKVMIDIIKSLK